MLIHIVNNSTLINDADITPAVAAVQKQVREHLFPAWGVGADLAFVPKGSAAPDDAWIIWLVDVCQNPDDLGYHSAAALPSGIVGIKTCADEGTPWQSCLSHETLEMIVDPWTQLGFQVGSTLYSLEVCDPVEGQPYAVDGVPVENFVLPTWFRPNTNGPWDHCDKLSAPLTLLTGGYFQTATVSEYAQTNGERVRASKRAERPESRRFRRHRR